MILESIQNTNDAMKEISNAYSSIDFDGKIAVAVKDNLSSVTEDIKLLHSSVAHSTTVCNNPFKRMQETTNTVEDPAVAMKEALYECRTKFREIFLTRQQRGDGGIPDPKRRVKLRQSKNNVVKDISGETSNARELLVVLAFFIAMFILYS